MRIPPGYHATSPEVLTATDSAQNRDSLIVLTAPRQDSGQGRGLSLHTGGLTATNSQIKIQVEVWQDSGSEFDGAFYATVLQAVAP